MKEALKQAKLAFDAGEVPIGAVLVYDNLVIARAYNQTEMLNDPTAHAEMLVITAGTEFLGAKYLKNCKLYVTVEPCPMCAGASYWAQVSEIIYGAKDEKRGYSGISSDILHPRTKVKRGVSETEAKALMRDFFYSLRDD